MAKKALLPVLGLMVLITGCKKELIIEENPISNASNRAAVHHENPSSISFIAPSLFPEGVVYDPIQNWFYVSSVTQGSVGIVKMDGSYQSFITDPLLTITTGLKIDKAKKRLWVANVENGIGVYNLPSGDRLFFADLSTLIPGIPVFINDVGLDPNGNAYVTNSFAPVIYKVSRDGTASVFFYNAAFATGPGEFGFNGIQYDNRGFVLVAFADKLVKINTDNPDDYSIVQLNAAIFPDGLLLSKNGKELLIVNNTGGTPDDSVLSFITDDQWESGMLTNSFSTGPVFPTTLTSDGKSVYVLYSHLDKFLSGNSHDSFTIQKVPFENKYSF